MLRKTKKLVRIALIVLLLLIFSFSLYQIISTICHYSESEETYKDIVANVVTIKDADDINEQEGEKIVQAPIAVDFDALLSQNKDVVGWLYCENTPRLNLSRGLSAKKNKFTKKSKLRTALCLLNFDFYNFFIQSPLYV